MKYTLKITTILLAVLSFAACTNEEDNVFSESAANRLTLSMGEYSDLLKSSENGWAMQFFPSELEMGGIAMTAKFDGSEVELRSENSISYNGQSVKTGTPVQSMYSVKSEQGVILTFNTYNVLLHYYSQPKNPDDVDGYASDYEFVFQRVSENRDSIFFKGKKYGNEMTLVKLNGDAEKYISNVHSVDTAVAMLPRTKFVVGEKKHHISFNDHKLILTPDGATDDKKMTLPYVYNDKGFRLYEPLVLDGKAYSNFEYNTENGNIYAEGTDDNIPYPTKMEQFLGAKHAWEFIMDLTTGSHEMNDELYNLIAEKKDFSSYQILKTLHIGPNSYYISGVGKYAMTLQYGFSFFGFMMQYSHYGILLSADDDETVNISDGGPDNSYDFYKASTDSSREYIINHSPYKVKFNDGLNATSATFVSTKDSNVWFNIKIDENM